MNNYVYIPTVPGRLALTAGALVLLVAALLLWEAAETQAGTTPPAWETFAQHEATARYWLDDDPGPEMGLPQEVDEQEHVY